SIKADVSVSKVRPYVTAIEARNGKLDDETIRQIITMQEDLHNGLGRRRKKASIGINDIQKIDHDEFMKELKADSDYKFVKNLIKTIKKDKVVV
ncbi:MAG: hypothetical protein KGL95_02840, partial [Patescibacteria group bacterium]|nr:hypothetical protein [Patescibacteria group bacterium]